MWKGNYSTTNLAPRFEKKEAFRRCNLLAHESLFKKPIENGKPIIWRFHGEHMPANHLCCVHSFKTLSSSIGWSNDGRESSFFSCLETFSDPSMNTYHYKEADGLTFKLMLKLK